MTYPAIASTSSGNSGGNVASTAITLPAGVASGDLLLVAFTKDGGDVPTSLTGSGWALLTSGVESPYIWSAVYWKIADGSDALTINHATINEGTAWVAYRITGHAASTAPEGASAASPGGGAYLSPNAPSLNPAVWDVEDTLWIAALAWDGDRTLSAYPASYTDNQTTNRWVNTQGGGIAVATRSLRAASDDPAAGTLSTAGSWVAITVAIRPSVAGSSGSDVSTTVAVTNAGDSAAITGTAATAAGPVSATVAVTDSGDASSVTGTAANAGIKLLIGLDHDRGAEAASLTGLRWVVFAADLSTVAAAGSGLATDAGGVASITVAGSGYVVGDYVPVLIADYNAATAAVDRTVRSMFGFVPAVAAP
jgi:hypothetical protein